MTSEKTNTHTYAQEESNSAMLLHACCGPCSLEPVRVLRERGEEPHIFYANSNIAPKAEYEHRRETISEWARGEDLGLTEGIYDAEAWTEKVSKPWEQSAKDEKARRERCKACYRLRFDEAAQWAHDHGFTSLGTTLSVSPYQYTDVIKEQLIAACADAGIEAAFEDWRPYYDEATRRSRAAGMYRQNYCGCAYSAAEAQHEREERKAARAAAKNKYLEEHAEEIAAEKEALDKRREERRHYDDKRAKQRAILRQMRGL